MIRLSEVRVFFILLPYALSSRGCEYFNRLDVIAIHLILRQSVVLVKDALHDTLVLCVQNQASVTDLLRVVDVHLGDFRYLLNDLTYTRVFVHTQGYSYRLIVHQCFYLVLNSAVRNSIDSTLDIFVIICCL